MITDLSHRRPQPARVPAPIDISLLIARTRERHGPVTGQALRQAIGADFLAEADRYLAERGIDPDGPDDPEAA